MSVGTECGESAEILLLQQNDTQREENETRKRRRRESMTFTWLTKQHVSLES